MHARFPRRIEALAQVFEFTEVFCAQHGEITHDCALALDFAVEELFTNLVKYQPGEAPVEIELRLEGGPHGRTDVAMRAACVTITAPESRPFDPRVAPDAAIDRPALERQPGENCAVMAADQLRAFLEHGNIRNAVNFPALTLESAGGWRVAISNRNVPGMLGQVMSVLADREINVIDMINKSRGDVAYNLIDVAAAPSADLIREVSGIDSVINVRVFDP